MRRIAFFLLAVAAAWAADDPWTKVRELKSGTELRVYKRGSATPILAKMDEATADKLLLVVKNAQTTIAKADIDRVDYRPVKPRVTTQSSAGTTEPDTRPQPMGTGSPRPGTNYSSGLSVTSKPDFETIYRRPPPAPRK